MDLGSKIEALKIVLTHETEVEWGDKEDESGGISIFPITPFAFSKPAMRSWRQKLIGRKWSDFPIGDYISFEIDQVTRICTTYTHFSDGRKEELRKLKVDSSESRSPEDTRFFSELNKIYMAGEPGKMGLNYWVKWLDADMGGQFFALSLKVNPQDLERDEDYNQLIDKSELIGQILREPAQRGLAFVKTEKLPADVTKKMSEFLGGNMPGKNDVAFKRT